MGSYEDLSYSQKDDFEKKLLSTLISKPKIFDIISSKIDENDFINDKNRSIFKAICSLLNRGENLLPSLLIEQIKKDNMFTFIGGLDYIIEILSLSPLSDLYEYYLKNVIEAGARKYLKNNLDKLTKKIEKDSIPSLITEFENIAIELQKKKITENEIKNLKELSEQFVKLVYIRATEKVASGIESGYTDLDELTQGFQKSELIILGARPSIGKTALAICMLINISVVKNIPAGFFSLEMSGNSIAQRIYSIYGNISNQKLRKSMLSKQDLSSIENITNQISKCPLYVCDTPNIKLFDLKTTARKMKALYDIKIIFIDYVGLIVPDELESHPRHEQVSFISRNLKSLCRELQIPIVLLSQVTRDTEGKAPTLANLRESGSLEQDADVVLFLHRDRHTKNKEGEIMQSIDTKLIIAKQRNGPIDDIDLSYIPEYTRFESKIKGI